MWGLAEHYVRQLFYFAPANENGVWIREICFQSGSYNEAGRERCTLFSQCPVGGKPVTSPTLASSEGPESFQPPCKCWNQPRMLPNSWTLEIVPLSNFPGSQKPNFSALPVHQTAHSGPLSLISFVWKKVGVEELWAFNFVGVAVRELSSG